ncbi:xyloglucan galactosyltransferase MUR3-like, partial [Olea europaea subsp. europaea]
MPPLISRGSFENIKLGGTNIGGTMVARRGGCSGESPQGCCSINIYINNDTMGINNSILIGSDVKMGDPGVSLSLKDVKMDRGFQLLSKKKESDFVSYLCLMTLFAFIVLTILFLLT